MSASDNRQGPVRGRIRYALGQSALGAVLAAMSERGLCEIALGDDPDELARDFQRRFPEAEPASGKEAEAWLVKVIRFVEMPASGLDLPLDIRGTAFQQKVWQALRQIPAGTKVSYTDIAERIGAPKKSVRAVAAAIAANTLAVAVPCHRVIRADGSLSGYRWGVERKAELLRRESGVGGSNR
ncbi:MULTISPECIES: methylated-DNA--[protein]-cysteine S-methyltransferase [Methylomicrobium]|uniref:methylated-DNA--[protein]-cysteine S-methyltransferase n=1 Tax=Methylomicrobium TaxID=39773 RepID=UPI00020D8B00|nr:MULTISPECIES: methylated-DNA--[protein]-cysteine S-methyltransferase [Methylomicrobium]